MNEFIEVQFRKDGKRLRINRQLPGGIEFDEPDAIERTVGIDFDARSDATRERMNSIRRVTVDAAAIQSLPLVDRNVYTLLDLTPGVPEHLAQRLSPTRPLFVTFHVTAEPLLLPERVLEEAAEIALDAGATVVAAQGTHSLAPVKRRLREIETLTKQTLTKASLPTAEDIRQRREQKVIELMKVWLGRGRYQREREMVTQLVAEGHDPLEVAAAALKLARAGEKQRPAATVAEVVEKPTYRRGDGIFERRSGGRGSRA